MTALARDITIDRCEECGTLAQDVRSGPDRPVA
jgi:hypothetical protein